jgi:hypothetical protein
MDDKFDWGSPLKKHSLKIIEDTIAKALGKLCGEELQCDINALEFPSLGSATFQLSVSQRLKGLTADEPKTT